MRSIYDQCWSQHLYSYCGNNPINYIDPTGHSLLPLQYRGDGRGTTDKKWLEEFYRRRREKAAAEAKANELENVSANDRALEAINTYLGENYDYYVLDSVANVGAATHVSHTTVNGWQEWLGNAGICLGYGGIFGKSTEGVLRYFGYGKHGASTILGVGFNEIIGVGATIESAIASASGVIPKMPSGKYFTYEIKAEYSKATFATSFSEQGYFSFNINENSDIIGVHDAPWLKMHDIMLERNN